MARLSGVEPAQASWLTRLIYRIVRRKIKQITGQDRLVEPIKIMAHHPRLLRALGAMESGQAAACLVDPALKTLASIKTAMLIGCPY